MKRILFVVLAMWTGTVCAQQIEVTNGIYYLNNKEYTGKYNEYSGKAKIATYTVRNGKLNGRVWLYDTTGALKEQRSYHKGWKHGVWFMWDIHGQKSARAAYRNDRKHGRWLIWDPQGRLRYAMRYRHGAKVGTWRMWNETGDVSMEKNYNKTNE